jgi:methyl-accepting chemotaxis protein
VKLAEHNQAIGEIIAAVDDIAEQANLLAVNASIEASKAGEHGKGFMIVAQEIKSMSELSKQATKQVRSILNDIQKSSSAAVMATERGSKAVEATVRQSSGTGEAIQALASSIGEASQAVIQIAASNQQQLIGMDQVAVAMNNIKQATTQNAASTKQVEITIRNLQEIGGKLKEMVRHYKV